MENTKTLFGRTLVASAVAIALGTAGGATTVFAADDGGNFKTSIEYDAYRGDSSMYTLRASDIIGAEVMNADDEEIGEIDDLVVKKDGAQILAIISVGGFLGLGDRLVAVPYNELRIGEDDDEVYLDATKEGLEAKPEFAYTEGEVYGRERLSARDERRAAMTDDEVVVTEEEAEEAENALDAGWARVKSEWADLKAGAKEQWSELTDDDLNEIDGEREVLVDRVGERYEKDRTEAEKDADDWVRTL